MSSKDLENSQGTAGNGLDPIIIDTDDLITTSGEEIVISEADESQKSAFESNVNNYKNSLSAIMREKAMISTSLYGNIIGALKSGKGGKKAGVDVKFYSWCKTHFKIVINADMELLCSAKDGRRVAVHEDYYQVTCSPNNFKVR